MRGGLRDLALVVAVIVACTVAVIALDHLWAPAKSAPARAPATMLRDGKNHTLYAPPTSPPALAVYDEATRTLTVTEQGRAYGVRCAP